MVLNMLPERLAFFAALLQPFEWDTVIGGWMMILNFQTRMTLDLTRPLTPGVIVVGFRSWLRS